MTPREVQLLTIAAEAGPTWPYTARGFAAELGRPRWHTKVTVEALRPVLRRLVSRGWLAGHRVGRWVDYTITATGRDAIEQEWRE